VVLFEADFWRGVVFRVYVLVGLQNFCLILLLSQNYFFYEMFDVT